MFSFFYFLKHIGMFGIEDNEHTTAKQLEKL